MGMDRIEKTAVLKAPVSKVWKALIDHRQFGAWFKTTVETPFVEGMVSEGNITYPGYEHLRFEAHVVKIEPERYFAFRWPHYDFEKNVKVPEPMTLVEFKLEPVDGGTRLTIIESGFDKLPEGLRQRAFTGNEGGWAEQLKNIDRHVSQTA